MPRGDQTGPMGQGEKTGRGLGSCSGNQTTGFMNQGRGRGCGMGYGRGRGGGRGRQNRFAWNMPPAKTSDMTTEGEKEYLESEMQTLQEQLQNVQQRLDALSTKSENEAVS
ncbi:DUF5320 domain-containing protein [Planctomycetota bacterium]